MITPEVDLLKELERIAWNLDWAKSSHRGCDRVKEFQTARFRVDKLIELIKQTQKGD